MTVIDTLGARNEEFARQRFTPIALGMPTFGAIVISCADPRVDPAHIMGLNLGEAVVIRNIGGRITPNVVQEMALLLSIPRLEGTAPAPAGGSAGLSIVVLHHTDCGITRLARAPEELAPYLGVTTHELEEKAVLDPYASVRVDVALLRTIPALPPALSVSGLVYDVETGRIEVVVPPERLRQEEPNAR